LIELEQTRLGHDVGNCFETAVACLLECVVDDVPTWGDLDWADYIAILNAWLEPRGLAAWSIFVLPDPSPLSVMAHSLPPTRCIVGVRTTAYCNHAMIVEGNRIVWDPSPFRDNPVGLIGGHDPVVDLVFVLVPLDPARCS
jgi:hypothetical protein